MTNMTGSKLSIFSHHPGKMTGYWITTRSFPYRGPYWPGANMGLDFVSGQYGCLFSRCLGMITRPIWKCPCINLYLLITLSKYVFHILLISFCFIFAVFSSPNYQLLIWKRMQACVKSAVLLKLSIAKTHWIIFIIISVWSQFIKKHWTYSND